MPIYLDYNATTPVDPAVAETILPFLLLKFGNPSSTHPFGIEAKVAIEEARKQVAGLINAHPDEIIFTSGGSEANNHAIKGIAFAEKGGRNHIITSVIEHPAVIEVCRFLEDKGFAVTYLPVDDYGRIDPGLVEKAIIPETILITIMHANNEVGTIQPVDEIGKIARRFHILFHTDAAQTAGKIPVDVRQMNVDLLSIAGHKFYAPKGIGALFVRRGVRLEKLIHGADHEQNLRAGTENVMQIAGLGKASEMARLAGPDLMERLTTFRDMLDQGIRRDFPEVRLNGHPINRLPNTLSLGFPGTEAAVMLNQMKGIAASGGAACHAGHPGSSYVLEAMRVPERFAAGTIRFSVGKMTTKEEIDTAISIIREAYGRLLGKSPASFISRHEKRPGTPEIEYTGKTQPGTDSFPGMNSDSVSHLPQPEFRLTGYTHSLGCACKIRPQLLEKILSGLPLSHDVSVLVGYETSDDAAVYQIDQETAIVETVDFIPPIVDDPYTYGAIAAANALSDIYAMGARPLFALSIVAFPDDKLPLSVLEQILKGATDKVAEAGIPVIGGHSIEDHEPKFGLVVTGKVHPGRILRNSTACPGDVIILTKPIGTGIITTAVKRGLADHVNANEAIRVMLELNSKAMGIMTGYPVNACTDVTGFGLLGHLLEILTASGVGAEIMAESIPVIPGTWEYAAAGCIPGGTLNNAAFVRNRVHWEPGIPELLRTILADAQTSGGLLLTLPSNCSDSLTEALHQHGIPKAAIIGHIIRGKPSITVREGSFIQ